MEAAPLPPGPRAGSAEASPGADRSLHASPCRGHSPIAPGAVGSHQRVATSPAPFSHAPALKRFRERPGSCSLSRGNNPRVAPPTAERQQPPERSIFSTGGGCSDGSVPGRRSSPLPARHTTHRVLPMIMKTQQTHADLVRGPRTKPASVALCNGPAVRTDRPVWVLWEPQRQRLHPAGTSNTRSAAGRRRQQHARRAVALRAAWPCHGPRERSLHVSR